MTAEPVTTPVPPVPDPESHPYPETASEPGFEYHDDLPGKYDLIEGKAQAAIACWYAEARARVLDRRIQRPAAEPVAAVLEPPRLALVTDAGPVSHRAARPQRRWRRHAKPDDRYEPDEAAPQQPKASIWQPPPVPAHQMRTHGPMAEPAPADDEPPTLLPGEVPPVPAGGKCPHGGPADECWPLSNECLFKSTSPVLAAAPVAGPPDFPGPENGQGHGVGTAGERTSDPVTAGPGDTTDPQPEGDAEQFGPPDEPFWEDDEPGIVPPETTEMTAILPIPPKEDQ